MRIFRGPDGCPPMIDRWRTALCSSVSRSSCIHSRMMVATTTLVTLFAASGTFGLKVKRPSLERLKVLQLTRTVGSTGLKESTGP